MRKYKVYETVKFPFGDELLDMTPYTKAGLARQEATGANENLPAKQFKYELVGILVHTGKPALPAPFL
jgi:hypothetical protein